MLSSTDPALEALSLEAENQTLQPRPTFADYPGSMVSEKDEQHPQVEQKPIPRFENTWSRLPTDVAKKDDTILGSSQTIFVPPVDVDPDSSNRAYERDRSDSIPYPRQEDNIWNTRHSVSFCIGPRPSLDSSYDLVEATSGSLGNQHMHLPSPIASKDHVQSPENYSSCVNEITNRIPTMDQSALFSQAGQCRNSVDGSSDIKVEPTSLSLNIRLPSNEEICISHFQRQALQTSLREASPELPAEMHWYASSKADMMLEANVAHVGSDMKLMIPKDTEDEHDHTRQEVPDSGSEYDPERALEYHTSLPLQRRDSIFEEQSPDLTPSAAKHGIGDCHCAAEALPFGRCTVSNPNGDLFSSERSEIVEVGLEDQKFPQNCHQDGDYKSVNDHANQLEDEEDVSMELETPIEVPTPALQLSRLPIGPGIGDKDATPRVESIQTQSIDIFKAANSDASVGVAISHWTSNVAASIDDQSDLEIGNHSVEKSDEPETCPFLDPAIRQSVEPESPHHHHHESSASAYTDRSPSPSPVSIRGDMPLPRTLITKLEICDRETSFPSLDGLEATSAVSAISPDAEGNIKIMKRGDRAKLSVQGARVGKGKKVRDITRKQTMRKITEKKIEAIKDNSGDLKVPDLKPRRASARLQARKKLLDE